MPIQKPNGDIVKYIREARAAGLSDLNIVKNLLGAGWGKSSVKASLAFAGRANKKIRAARINSVVGVQRRKSYKKLIIFVVVCLLLGSASVSWLLFKRFVVQARTVLGYSLPESVVRAALTERNMSFTYKDEASIALRQGTNSVNIQQPETTFVIPIRPTKTTSKIFASVTYKKTVRENSRLIAYYDGIISPELFADVVEQSSMKKIVIDKVSIPSEAIQDIARAWINSEPLIEVHFSVDILKRELLTFGGKVNAPSILSSSKQALVDNLSPKNGGVAIEMLKKAETIQTALEKYRAENGGYPNSNNLEKNLIPKYLNEWPQATGTPACSEYYNEFTYTHENGTLLGNQANAYPSYNVTFCLPEDAGSHKAGIAILKPDGIVTSTTCPGNVPGCFTKAIEVVENETDSKGPAKLEFRLE